MKFTSIRAKKIRQNFINWELKFKSLNFIIRSLDLPQSLRWKAMLLKSKYKNSIFSKIKSRCLLTGRSRGLLTRQFGLSRIQFRNLARNNELPFVKKNSW